MYPSEELLLPEPGKEVRLTFAEAQKLLREEGPEEYRNVRDDEDMSTPQEKALGAVVRAKFHTDFYVIDKFPETARPFYAKLDPSAPAAGDGTRVTNAYDFFLRGQEILSGGERINDPDELEARIRAKGIDPTSAGIKDYIGTFRQVGVPPHGGGGIGLDRVVAWYLALPQRSPRGLLSADPEEADAVSPPRQAGMGLLCVGEELCYLDGGGRVCMPALFPVVRDVDKS